MGISTTRLELLACIDAEEIILGNNVRFGEGVRIAAIGGPAKRVVIGDNVFLGPGVLVLTPEFHIGDYGTIYQNCRLTGYEPLRIGHNFWCDQNCILNCTARLAIGDNVGIGAYSQLWTHIKYGDTLVGCRFDAAKPMTIHHDVWFVGQCLVSPIVAEPWSMAMLGSTVVKDMGENRIYAGSPAKDLTDKLGGPPFVEVSLAQRLSTMEERLDEFLRERPEGWRESLQIVQAWPQDMDSARSYFHVGERSYTKRRSEEEVAFMRFLLPTAKFTPTFGPLGPPLSGTLKLIPGRSSA
jgi:acetyltransferase-like isoleucine patch superfamily enzyme